jgi:hypothetical protein
LPGPPLTRLADATIEKTLGQVEREREESSLFTICLEEVFSETGLPVYGVLGNSKAEWAGVPNTLQRVENPLRAVF